MDYKEITTWELACKAKGISSELPNVSWYAKEKQKYMTSCHTVPIVIEAINGNWKADHTDNTQPKYELFIWVKKDTNSPSGFVLSRSNTVYVHSYAIAGARLCFETRQKAYHFLEYFEQMFLTHQMFVE